MNGERTLARYIKALAERFGDRPAVHFKSAFRTFTFSYREMYGRCLRVANYFDRKGIRKGDTVLIWSYNGQEYASVLLGCALSGVVAVPIDFNNKADFVARIAGKVGAKHLFHSKRRPFAHAGLSHIHVEDLDRELAGVPIEKTDFGVSDDDLYEIVYTSGTTSAPKGVVITHRNLVSNIMNCNAVMPIDDRQRFLSILPLSHMFEQVAGFFYPLYYGCSITYLHSRKSSAIVEALQRERVTIIVTVPVFLETLRQSILREARAQGREAAFSRGLAVASRLPRFVRRFLFRRIHEKFGGELDMVICGAAALDPDLERFWTTLGLRIYPGYGLTEASPVVSLNTPAHHRSGSVGRSLPNQEIRLGPQNEIWIRGDHVTPGYLDHPEENAVRFDADGWYKTGDIGELDGDGFLFIRGRLKNMIKSASGVNIYPEDIETVLNRMPGVRDSCVIGLEAHGDVAVHAVLLMEKGRERSDADARPLVDSTNQALQPHQQIQGFTIWPHEDFPRTHTLKIKRDPVRDEIQGKQPAGPAMAGATGDRIVDLVADVAGVNPDAIRPESNLVTDLGLDSIDRVELATMLEEEFHVEIDESAITPEMTVAGLRQIIAVQEKAALDYTFPHWARRWPVRILRRLLQLVVFRIPSLVSWTTVKGRKNLKGVKQPVIFIANHVNHYDAMYVVRAIPWRFRKLAIAAAADVLYEYRPGDGLAKWLNVRLRGYFTTLVFHTFPFSRSVHVKRSFEYMGGLLDEGWNVLLFPEGKLTMTGEMASFKSGIGLLTQAMRVPVVPLRIDGLFPLVRIYDGDRAGWTPQKFVHVRLTFGKPLDIAPESDPDEIARTCENAIRSLPGKEGRGA